MNGFLILSIITRINKTNSSFVKDTNLVMYIYIVHKTK